MDSRLHFEQHEAQRRRDGQGDEQARRDRQNVTQRQRPEERAREPRKEENGHKDEDDDHAGINHRAAHFERGLQHDCETRFARVLPHAPQDVLHVDDRIIHDLAERDDQSGENHRIDRLAHPCEQQQRHGERQRDRGDADDRGAPITEEQRQHDHHEQAAEPERFGEMMDRNLDEARRAEDGAVDGDARQRGLQFLEHLFDALRDIERVSPRLLLDDEQDAVTVIDHRIADGRRIANLDLRDIAKANRRAIPELHHGPGEIFRRLDQRKLRHAETEVRCIDKTARADHRRVARRTRDGIQRHTGRAELLRINEHLELLVPLSPDRHIRHAFDRHESRAHRPACQFAHLHLRQCLRPEAHLQNTAQR